MDRIRLKNHRGFTMELWIRYDRKEGEIYSYKVWTPTGVKFRGRGYKPSPLWRTRTQVLDGLLHFICLRPGDTDQEYFKWYTPEQLEWANSYECELTQSILDEIKNTS